MKDSLIQIDGKFYKEHDVVMLPTEDKSVIGLNRKQGNLYYFNPVVSGEGQHLYILSDEEIKENDWCICKGKVWPNLYGVLGSILGNKEWIEEHCRKIIATTDKSLDLSRPSNEFLEAYIKAQGKIDKVLVEYERFFTEEYSGIPPKKCKISSPNDYKLKVALDNTITCKKLEERCQCCGKVL